MDGNGCGAGCDATRAAHTVLPYGYGSKCAYGDKINETSIFYSSPYKTSTFVCNPSTRILALFPASHRRELPQGLSYLQRCACLAPRWLAWPYSSSPVQRTPFPSMSPTPPPSCKLPRSSSTISSRFTQSMALVRQFRAFYPSHIIGTRPA